MEYPVIYPFFHFSVRQNNVIERDRITIARNALFCLFVFFFLSVSIKVNMVLSARKEEKKNPLQIFEIILEIFFN